MVNYVAGLLLGFKQMREFGTFVAGTPLPNADDAFPYCCEEVERFRHRVIVLDYPKGSLKCKIMLVLWEHDSKTKFNVKKAKRSKLTMTARVWLKARGVSDTEKLKFVDTENTFRG